MNSLFEFVHHNPTQIHFGPSSLSHLPSLIPADARVLLLYGGGSIKATGLYDQVRRELGDRVVIEFAGVEPNPTLESLNRAVQVVRQERCNFLLAVGGGSCVDAAKFVGAAAVYEGDSWDLVSGRQPVTTTLPVGVVLTLAATGSEANGAAVVTRKSTHEKRVFFSPVLFPRFAILNPLLLTTLPDSQLANGLVDAFVHVCEQYLTASTGALVQEGHAEGLLRALRQLAKTFEQRRDPQWLQNLMWAASQALAGLVGAGLPRDFATHEISHELTELYGIDHARTLSILHASVLRETVQEKNAKLVQMGRQVFGLTSGRAEDTIAAIEAMYRSIGMPTHLRDTESLAADSVDRVLAGVVRDAPFHPMSPLGGLGIERMRRAVAASCGV